MATRTDQLVDRVTDRIDDLRDSTAGALSSDEAPSLRELGRVRRSLDDAEERLAARLDDLHDQQAALASEVHSSNKSTTFPRKMFWMLVGGAAAALGTWLADPDRGQARRQQLADQARTQANRVSEQAKGTASTVAEDAKARAASLADDAKATASDLADDAKDRASHSADVAKGKAQGAINEAGSDDVPDDPVLLEQRVKSQVMGHRGDVDDVVLVIGDPGHVILKGVVPDEQSKAALVAAVADVNGVVDVQSELSTRN